VVDDCHSQIDLQLFRERLAPALGVTHRFVGSEPLCELTRRYNQRMRQLLEAPGDAPAIQVVELARVEKEAPISASRCAGCISSASGRRLRRWCRRGPLFLMHLAEANTKPPDLPP
jgi:[citrate (pro-3S)-lyase] ligase